MYIVHAVFRFHKSPKPRRGWKEPGLSGQSKGENAIKSREECYSSKSSSMLDDTRSGLII